MLSLILNFPLFQICECAMKLCYWVVDRDTADNIVAKLLKKLENTSDLGQFHCILLFFVSIFYITTQVKFSFA